MLVQFAGIMVVVSPALLLAVLGLTTLFRIPLSERSVARSAQTSSIVGLIASLCILAWMLARISGMCRWNWVTGCSGKRTRAEPARLPLCPSTGGLHAADRWAYRTFSFPAKFVFDRLSVPFAIMSFVLCGVIGAFAFRYLHREEGYYRFFLYYSIFQLGMIISSLAGTIETLFMGWELVGLSSALLVAFFHDRPAPVQTGCASGLCIVSRMPLFWSLH